jgi:hypothetical protein
MELFLNKNYFAERLFYIVHPLDVNIYVELDCSDLVMQKPLGGTFDLSTLPNSPNGNRGESSECRYQRKFIFGLKNIDECLDDYLNETDRAQSIELSQEKVRLDDDTVPEESKKLSPLKKPRLNDSICAHISEPCLAINEADGLPPLENSIKSSSKPDTTVTALISQLTAAYAEMNAKGNC